MKYVYTDFTELPVSIKLTVGEINSLIEFLGSVERDKNPWTVSNFEELLVNSLKNTAALMTAEAKNMEGKEDA